MKPVLRLSTCLLLAAACSACQRSETPSAPNATPSASTPAAASTADASTSSASSAATPSDGAAGDDVAAIDLTMDKVRAYTQALKVVAKAQDADPSIDIAENASEESDAQYIARLEANPKIRAAVATAGLSARDFARINLTLVSAMMAEGAIEAGQLKSVPDGIDPASVEFVKQHKTELQALMGGS